MVGVRSRRSGLALVVAIALSAFHGSAGHADPQADETSVCIAAVEQGQLARYKGHLRAARAEFVTCARDTCPGAIRTDCARWFAETEASTPSGIFVATWSDGTDASGLRVAVDGETLTASNDGRATALDPGSHLFRFEVDGAPPIERQYVIREGEKNRAFPIVFARAPTGTAPAEPGAPAVLLPRSRPVPASVYVAGGAGLAGLIAFAVLGILGTSELDEMRTSCKPKCTSSNVSAARDKLLVGDIAAYAGAGALGLAAVLFFTRPYARDAAPRTSARIGVGPTSLSAVLQTQF